MAWLTGERGGLGRWMRRGLDLLYPPRCAICGAEGEPFAEPAEGAAERLLATVCDGCSRRLSADRPRCPRCGEPGAPDDCGRCAGRATDVDGLVVLGPYADDLRTCVLRAKRPAGDLVSAGLGALLVDRHRDTLAAWPIDVVVPVPMHWMRRALRGTSAAEEIARGVARALGLPSRRLLRRWRATRMQNELPVGERRGNVRGAFRASPHVAGLRLLLVDDVTTTGATLAACRQAAISAGAVVVYAAVVARADRADAAADV